MVIVKLLAHSINPRGVDITSWELEYNKSIHAELMTHRVFSRNAGSSRAIPLPKALSSVEKNPALPVIWGGHKPGMSPGEELPKGELDYAKECDNNARYHSMKAAELADSIGLHKSITNRWIDPWAHIKVIVTTTGPNLNNFFQLRCHPAAEPIFQCLAYKMLELYDISNPTPLQWGDWHMPYHDRMPNNLTIEERLKLATARACWVSYNNPGKTEFNIEDAFARHDSCIALGHWSPLEHCAQATKDHCYPLSNFDYGEILSGWLQYRKTFPEENRIAFFDRRALLAERPAFTLDPNFVM